MKSSTTIQWAEDRVPRCSRAMFGSFVGDHREPQYPDEIGSAGVVELLGGRRIMFMPESGERDLFRVVTLRDTSRLMEALQAGVASAKRAGGR